MSDELPQSTDLWSQVVDSVAERWPPDRWRDLGVVVGCSGGADSVALVLALATLRESQLTSPPNDSSEPAIHARQSGETRPQDTAPRGFLVVAHMNHGLRGTESDGDAEFTEALARRLGLEFRLGHCAAGVANEASMRQHRMDFLAASAEQLGARYVTVAHNQDDSVETCLHHLMRGTGPNGMSGIAPFRDLGTDAVLARPLLGIRRSQIRVSLRQIGQPWREDASNEDSRYRRNWIRGQLIPKIETEYPHASEAIARLINTQAQWAGLIRRQSAEWIDSCVTIETTETVVVSTGTATDDVVVIDALQCLWDRQDWSRGDMKQTSWLRIARTIRDRGVERYTLPGCIDVRASGVDVLITVRG